MISAAGLNTISADPLYSRAYGCGWRSLRTGVRGELADDPMRLSPTWEIYERWCFVRLGEDSVLLVPRGGSAAWLEDHAFIEEHRVGVAPLIPEERAIREIPIPGLERH